MSDTIQTVRIYLDTDRLSQATYVLDPTDRPDLMCRDISEAVQRGGGYQFHVNGHERWVNTRHILRWEPVTLHP